MITQSLLSPPTDPTPPIIKIPNPAPIPSTPAPAPAIARARVCAAADATRFAHIESPVGKLLVTADAAGALTRLHFPGPTRSLLPADWIRDERPFADVRRQLDAYFAGELEDFDLRLAPSGTPFQMQVWSALRAIPYGATASYGDIARAVGQPGAARAVGGANNRNPIAIVVPCHRVIGASGSLTGYGGGLDRKRRLLALEAGAPALM
jgi:methylated-DNA-[protein]-cysteine S-methyltransferase